MRARAPSRIAAPLARLAALACLATPASAQLVEYYHTDLVGNVRAVTDEKKNVIERHDYLPFGEECTTGGCASNPEVGAGQARKFTGKERDTETGLDYFGARYYGSKIGRFTTTDPYLDQGAALFNPQLWNRYAYGLNNPLRFVDPDGRQSAPAGQQIGTVDWIILRFNELLGPNDAVPNYVWIDTGPTKVVTTVDKQTVGKALIVVGAAAVAADALTEASKPKEGRYEFPDQAAGGTPYVGQSGNIPRRLRQHENAGRLTPGTEETTEVVGGKTAREIAEHRRIQEITGGVPAGKSDKVTNKVDPIGPNRTHLLDEKK
jgi:RHS repeat-associated protein